MSADLDKLNDAQLSEVFAVEVLKYPQSATSGPHGRWVHNGITWMCPSVLDFASSVDSVLPHVEKFAGHIFERCFDYERPHVARILPSLMYRETYRQEFRGQSTTLARAICIALILAKRAENGGAK